MILWGDGSFQTLTDYRQIENVYNWTYGPAFVIQNVVAINSFLGAYSKALVSIFLLAILIRLWQNKKAEINSFGLMLLTIMGVALFHTLLWESKQRYLFMVFGLLLMAAALGFDNLFSVSKVMVKENSRLEKFIGRKKYVKAFVLISSVLSLGLMVVLQSYLPKQNVVVTSQLHSSKDSYGYNDSLDIVPGETIYQEFYLPISADKIEFQSSESGLLDFKIERKKSETWETIGQYELLEKGGNSYQVFEPEMSSGNYRFAIYNPNEETARIKAVFHTDTLGYPYPILLEDGKTASFSFVVSQSKEISKFPTGLIITFSILYLLISLLVFLVEPKF